MARFPGSLSRFGLGFAILLAAAPAVAEDLVMPFACDAQSGRVRLFPSEPQPYHIYGPRERHVYSVCSPVDPNRCRNWMIHRFDVDCAGARVSWLSIVDAASRLRRNGRAWVEDGQMHLSVGPAWSPDREGLFPRRRWWRNGEPDELSAVSLPPGFAPTLGMRVHFVSGADGARVEGGAGPDARADGSWDAPASEALPPRERMAARDTAPGWNATPRPPDKAAKAASPAASKALPPVKEKVADKAPLPSDRPTPAPAPPKESAPAAAAPGAPSASPSANAKADTPKLPEGIVVPTIINGSQAAKGSQEEKAPAAEAPAPAPLSPAAGSDTAAGTAPSDAPADSGEKAEDAEASETVASAHDDAATTETSALPDASAPPVQQSPASLQIPPGLLWPGIAAAGVLSLCAFFLVWRRKDSPPADRDFGSVTFEAPPTGGTSLVAFSAARTPAAVEPHEAQLPVAADGVAADVAIPASLAEAFAVLGTNADAPTEVIKKIVDGLRQSWHSDLARSDKDRAYRERRMQQVNAAWELVLESRRAAA